MGCDAEPRGCDVRHAGRSASGFTRRAQPNPRGLAAVCTPRTRARPRRRALALIPCPGRVPGRRVGSPHGPRRPPRPESAGSDGVPATVPTVHPKLLLSAARRGRRRGGAYRVGTRRQPRARTLLGRNRRIEVWATTVAVLDRPQRATSPKYIPLLTVPIAPVPQHVRSSGGDRVEPSRPLLRDDLLAGVTVSQSPCSSRSFSRSESSPWKTESSRSSRSACIVWPNSGARMSSASSRSNVLLSTSNSSTSPSAARSPDAGGRRADPSPRTTRRGPSSAARGRRPSRDPRPRSVRCRGTTRRRLDGPPAGRPARPDSDPETDRPARSESTSSGRSSNAGSASISSAASTRHDVSSLNRSERTNARMRRQVALARFKRPRTTGPARKAARSSSRIRDQTPPVPEAPTREPKIASKKYPSRTRRS